MSTSTTPRTAMFLPCRAGSERVEHKNTRPFAGHSGGLLGVKLDQLEAVRGLDRVVLDSNDALVLDYGAARQARWQGASELIVTRRPDALGASHTTTDALIAYALETVACETLAWTHVTSPLFSTRHYEAALAAYHTRPDSHDSLMAVTALRTFLWRGDPSSNAQTSSAQTSSAQTSSAQTSSAQTSSPVNYQPTPIRWPRTQDLTPLYEVNSALFVVAYALAQSRLDRIGRSPLLWEVDKLAATDVDWEEDFALAELLFSRARLSDAVAPTDRV